MVLPAQYRQSWYRAKSKIAAAAILKITFLTISRPILHIFTLNLIQMMKMGSRSQIYCQNSHSAKIQDGGGRHFQISHTAITPPFLNRFAPNLTQRLKMRFQISYYPQNYWYPTKSKMAAAAILKLRFLATTGPLLHIFAPNSTQWQICRQNSHVAKIQDGGRHYFEIS